MKTTRQKNISNKIIALALVLVLLTTMFVGCNNKIDDETSTTTTTTNASQSDEDTTIANGDNISESDNQTETDESTFDKESSTVKNDAEENNTSKNNSSETTTKKNTSSGGKETTTKKNSSSGSTNKVTTTNKNSSTCSHSWGAYKWGTTESTYGDKYRTCSKCGKSESWELCKHSFGSWENVRLGCQERECSKCGWVEDRDADNADAFMGSKSEYLEFLSLLNKARKAEGLNELKYCPDGAVQEIANTRAKELTVKFSHTRPNGGSSGAMFSELIENGGMYLSNGEACHSGSRTAEGAFNSLMNSSRHKAILMNENSTHFVCARCDGYWVCYPLM